MPADAASGHLARIKTWARRLKTEVHALYLAYGDPRTPWYAKAVAFFVVAHTLSLIDLIPDFIPILGYLDDVIITPLGSWLALRLIPPEVMVDARAKAAADAPSGTISRVGLALVVAIWLMLFGALIVWLWLILFRGD